MVPGATTRGNERNPAAVDAELATTPLLMALHEALARSPHRHIVWHANFVENAWACTPYSCITIQDVHAINAGYVNAVWARGLIVCLVQNGHQYRIIELDQPAERASQSRISDIIDTLARIKAERGNIPVAIRGTGPVDAKKRNWTRQIFEVQSGGIVFERFGAHDTGKSSGRVNENLDSKSFADGRTSPRPADT